MPNKNRLTSHAFKFAFIVLVALKTAAADPPSLEIELRKSSDTVVILEEAGRTVIVVTTKTGIGQLKVNCGKRRWPKDITLRLHYAEPHPFTTMEGFELTSSRWQIKTNSAQSGKAPFFLIDDDGKFPADDRNPSGLLNLEFKRHGDDLDIIFPANFWRDEKEVQMQWIDYYRV